MNKNMIARISVALVAIPAILWICYQDMIWLMGLVSFITIIGMIEYLLRSKFLPNQRSFWVGMITMSLIFIWPFVMTRFNYLHPYIPFLLVMILLAIIILTRNKPMNNPFYKKLRLLSGMAYIGFLFPYVFIVSISNEKSFISAGDWMLFLLLILWVGDSMALFVGKSIGKHKLAPTVSPNKTVEGFIGGLLGAVLVGIIMYYWKFNSIEWYHVLLIAFFSSIFGQVGDLIESMWKRSIDIKDSSNIIPGHGGILDRFDSLLLAAPFMYCYKIIFNLI